MTSATLTLLSLLALVFVCANGSIVKLPIATSSHVVVGSPAVNRIGRNANANGYVNTSIDSFQILYVALTLTGSPSTFRLILDTGSQIPLAISTKCTCAFKPSAQYDATNLTALATFNQQYISQQVISGSYYNINVNLGSVSGTVPFGLADNAQGASLSGYDGILGLARVRTLADGCNVTTGEICTPNILESFVSSKLVAAEKFAITLDYQGNGQLVLGGDDETLYVASSMLYFPIYASTFYVVAGNGLFVGNTDTGVTASDYGNLLVDTGTSNLVLARGVFSKMISTFANGICKNTTYVNCSTLFTSAAGYTLEDIRDKLPPLVFIIEASSVLVSPYAYVVQKDVNGELRWVLAIQITPDSGGFPTSLLGSVFFRGKYVTHDMTYRYEDLPLAKGRLGIANLVGVNVSSSSSSGQIYTTITTSTTGDTSAAEKTIQICMVLVVVMSILLSVF